MQFNRYHWNTFQYGSLNAAAQAIADSNVKFCMFGIDTHIVNHGGYPANACYDSPNDFDASNWDYVTPNDPTIKVRHSSNGILSLDFSKSSGAQLGTWGSCQNVGSAGPMQTSSVVIDDLLSMRFDVLRTYSCGGTTPPPPANSPISRLTAINDLDLSAQAANSECAYTVHMRFDKSKVIFLQSQVKAADDLNQGVGHRLTFHYFDDGSGTIPADSSPVTGLSFTNALVEVSRTTATNVLEHPFQSPEIAPCSHDPNFGLTYSLTAADPSSPNLVLDSTTMPTKFLIPSLTGLITATHTYTVSVVSDSNPGVSASYIFELTVRDDCASASAIQKDILTMPTEIYLDLWYELLLAPGFSEPSGCPLMYQLSCAMCTTATSGYHIGSFNELTAQLRSIYGSVSSPFDVGTIFSGQIRAVIDGYDSNFADYDFNFQKKDPNVNVCDVTQVLIKEDLEEQRLTVGQSIDLDIQVVDSQSLFYGDKSGITHCGSKTYSISPTNSWMSVSAHPTQAGYARITLTPDNTASLLVSTDFIITVTMSAYPSAISGQATLPVIVALPCDSGPIIGPATALVLPDVNLITSFSADVVKDLAYENMVTKQHFDDCIPVVQWFKYIGLTQIPLSPSIFTSSFSSDLAQLSASPQNSADAGSYIIGYTVNFSGQSTTLEYMSPIVVTLNVQDVCTTADLQLVGGPPSQHFLFYNGDQSAAATSSTNEIKLADYFTTDMALDCPLVFGCKKSSLIDGSQIDCDYLEAPHTNVELNASTGVLDFQSSSQTNLEYPIGPQSLTLIAYSDLLQTHKIELTILVELECNIVPSEWVWGPLAQYEELQYVRKDYLGLPWDTTLIIDIPLSYTDYTVTGICPVSGTELLTSTSETIDLFGQATSDPPTSTTADTSLWPVSIKDLQAGFSQRVTYTVQVDNFYRLVGESYPEFTKVVKFVDGYSLLLLDSYLMLISQKITLDIVPSNQTFLLPDFEDDSMNHILLSHISAPQSQISFKILDQKVEESNAYFEHTINAAATNRGVSMEVSFTKKMTSVLNELDFIVCYSFDAYSNLADLCDETIIHKMTNSKGLCFNELESLGTVQPGLRKVISVEFGEQPFEILDLANEVDVSSLSPECGSLGFRSESAVIETSQEGKVSLKQVTEAKLLGTHEVSFEAYLFEIDSDHIYTLPLDLTVKIEISQSDEIDPLELEKIKGSLVKKAPIPTKPIETNYTVFYGEEASFTFEFASPLAIEMFEAENKTQEEFQITPAEVVIEVTENQNPSVFKTLPVGNTNGIGYSSIMIQVDGAQAQNTTVTQNQNLTLQKQSEEKQSVYLSVKDMSPGGSTAKFQIQFSFKHRNEQDDNLTNEDQFQSDEAKILAEQAAQKAKMQLLLKAAFNLKIEALQSEGIELKVDLDQIDDVGNLYLKYDPPIAAVPNDWNQLWDKVEHAKMSLRDREKFEVELIKIMYVSFEKNSDEEPQKYFYPEILNLDPRGIQIFLNFSDPLFVSQGDKADKVKIRLSKSYFMQPSPVLAAQYQRGRELAKLEEGEEYVTISVDIPLQMRNKKDKETLEKAIDVVTTVLTVTIVISFAISLLLHGVMSQLWNIFNTLQIILAMPLLAVILPANFLIVQHAVNQIINFQLVDQEILQSKLIDPIFGKKQDPSEIETDPVTQEQVVVTETNQESASLLAQTLQIIAFLIIVCVFIGLIVLCKKHLYSRCCPCFKKLVELVKAKLMFNSILRACIQSYLLTSISTCDSLLGSEFDDTKGSLEFAHAIILALALVAYPVWIAVFLTKKQEQLPKPAFSSKYDSIYQNVEVYKRQALFYTSVFLVRRLCFAILISVCGQSIVLQVQLADVLSTLMLIFFTTVWPMKDTLNNALQIFNEIIVLICIWLMFWFTQYVPDPSVRYDLAWKFIYLVAFNMCVNVLMLFYMIGRKVYIAVRKVYLQRQIKNALDKRILPQITSNVSSVMQSEEPEEKGGADMRRLRFGQSFVDQSILNIALQRRNHNIGSDLSIVAEERPQEEVEESESSSSEESSSEESSSAKSSSESNEQELEVETKNRRPRILVEKELVESGTLKTDLPAQGLESESTDQFILKNLYGYGKQSMQAQSSEKEESKMSKIPPIKNNPELKLCDSFFSDMVPGEENIPQEFIANTLEATKKVADSHGNEPNLGISFVKQELDQSVEESKLPNIEQSKQSQQLDFSLEFKQLGIEVSEDSSSSEKQYRQPEMNEDSKHVWSSQSMLSFQKSCEQADDASESSSYAINSSQQPSFSQDSSSSGLSSKQSQK